MSQPPRNAQPAEQPPLEDERVHALAEALTLPQHRDASLAPEVDESLLQGLARREFSGAAARTLHRVIDAYADWAAAYRRILLAETAKRKFDVDNS